MSYGFFSVFLECIIGFEYPAEQNVIQINFKSIAKGI